MVNRENPVSALLLFVNHLLYYFQLAHIMSNRFDTLQAGFALDPNLQLSAQNNHSDGTGRLL